jgi:RimJ/RimL family protein N-acetyltransferase
MLWDVLGEKRSGGQGYTSRAVSEVLTLGFAEVGLGAVNAWAVEENAASIRILERNHFR